MNKESTVKEKRKTHEKLNNAITVICILAIMISILAVVLITKDRFGKKPFSYPDSLGKTVIRVDDAEVTLKEFRTISWWQKQMLMQPHRNITAIIWKHTGI